jgi:hypothetical protein
MKNVYRLMQQFRQHVTIVLTIFANGTYLPPLFLFKV